MKILGWAQTSQTGIGANRAMAVRFDAPDLQQVLAIDAGTGEVYEPQLEALLQNRKDKQCTFRVTDAGFKLGQRRRNSGSSEVFHGRGSRRTEADVPVAKRCANRRNLELQLRNGRSEAGHRGNVAHLSKVSAKPSEVT